MVTELLYSHIPLSDLQENETLLEDSQLHFALLFYTLSYLQQQEENTEQQQTTFSFLKIPRRDHVQNPDGGTPQRKQNVEAFLAKCEQLLNTYKEYLSEEQKQILSSPSNDLTYLPKFSASFSIYEEQPTLIINYRGGKNMYKKTVLVDKSNQELFQFTEKLQASYKELAMLQRQLAIKEKEEKIINEKYRKLNKRRWAFKKSSRLHKLNNNLTRLAREKDGLTLKTTEAEQAVTQLEEDPLATEVSGGVIAAGGYGVGHLAQKVPVRLIKSKEDLQKINLIDKNRLFAFYIKNNQSSASTARLIANAYARSRKKKKHTAQQSAENQKEIKGILFRKVGLMYLTTTSDVNTNPFLREEIASQEATGGDLFLYQENSITLKPELLSTYREGHSLYNLIDEDPPLGFNQRLILLYLAFKGYQEKCLKQNYIHRDIKPDNFMVEREGNQLRVILCDYETAIPCKADEIVINTEKVGTRSHLPYEISQVGKTRFPYSRKSDMFALGQVTNTCLTANTNQQTLTRAQQKTLDFLSTFVTERMMGFEPGERPNLKQVMNVFAQLMQKHKIDLSKIDQQGELFEAYLPDKKESRSYSPVMHLKL